MSKKNPLLGDPYPIRRGIPNEERRPKTMGVSASREPLKGSNEELGLRPDPLSKKKNLREVIRKSGPVY